MGRERVIENSIEGRTLERYFGMKEAACMEV